MVESMAAVGGRSRARRHGPLGALVCSIALALVLSACGVSATGQTAASRPTQPAGPTVTLPAVNAPKGSFAFDYGQLRLWLPASWTAENETGCLTPLHDVVLLADACPHTGSHGTYLRLSPRATPAAGATKLAVGHTTVNQTTTTGPGIRWSVPSLQVTIQIVGSAARSVARTLGPSSLHALLALHHPVAVPGTWKTVRYDGIHARVPAHWQVVHELFWLTCHGFLNPGRRPPLVLLGDQDQDPSSSCPPGFDPTTQLRPTNGLWLSSTNAPFLPGGAGTITATTPLDGRTLTLRSTPSDGPLLEVAVRHGPRHTVAVIGLGTNPTTAEAILTSVRSG